MKGHSWWYLECLLDGRLNDWHVPIQLAVLQCTNHILRELTFSSLSTESAWIQVRLALQLLWLVEVKTALWYLSKLRCFLIHMRSSIWIYYFTIKPPPLQLHKDLSRHKIHGYRGDNFLLWSFMFTSDIRWPVCGAPQPWFTSCEYFCCSKQVRGKKW